MKNSIEEDINYLDSMVKEYKQFGNLYNEDYEDEDRIYQALEHILSDYKRVLKENEELKFKERRRIIGKYGDTEIHDVINRTLSNDYISVKKIKDKIENLKKVKERNIKRDFDTVYKDGYFTGGIDTLQELLESEE